MKNIIHKDIFVIYMKTLYKNSNNFSLFSEMSPDFKRAYFCDRAQISRYDPKAIALALIDLAKSFDESSYNTSKNNEIMDYLKSYFHTA